MLGKTGRVRVGVVSAAVRDKFEILRQIVGAGLNEGEGLSGKYSLLAMGRVSKLNELVPDLVEAGYVRDANLAHELDLELLAIATEFCRLDVTFLFKLFLALDCVLEVVEFISRRFNVLDVRYLTEKALIVQLLKLLIVSDVGLMYLDPVD